MSVFLLVGAVVFGLALFESVVVVSGLVGMGRLRSLDSTACSSTPPLVSIIVPACNEEKTIAKGVGSFLVQDYPNLEIVIIDDRSTDKTYDRLIVLQKQFPSLKIYQVKVLPDGWIGKSHALSYGASLAKGDYLLFTDADIQMKEGTVSSAVAYMEKNNIDHLSLFFRNISDGWFLDSLVLDGCAGLMLLFRPWRVSDPRSKAFVGVGAFNMVRKDVYREIGGHSSIRMHPIDDIMLGKVIKRKGMRQQCLLGLDFVSVHWYESVSQMINGMMKNVFSLFHYRVSVVCCTAIASILVHIMPLWGALLVPGYARLLFLLALSSRLAARICIQSLFRGSRWCIIGFLAAPYLSIYIVIKSAWLTVRTKGIEWRGTFYPLSELKKSEPILF